MMSKKHYIAIAKAIKSYRDAEEGKFLDDFIDDLCVIFKDDNPKFKEDTFKEFIKRGDI
jgi:hypothetical protein